MKIAQNIKLGARLLIVFNLMMAFGSIWVFMRMAPAIEIIIDQNGKSLHACEEMLSILALANSEENDIAHLEVEFQKALSRANRNITEKEEPAVIDAITKNFVRAFNGSSEDKKEAVSDILYLAKINRQAMVSADLKARQFGNAGAWVIVFMASTLFLVGMLFIKGMQKNLVGPLEEINSVLLAVKNGDSMRRCTGSNFSKDVRFLLEEINDMLDKNIPSVFNEKNGNKELF